MSAQTEQEFDDLIKFLESQEANPDKEFQQSLNEIEEGQQGLETQDREYVLGILEEEQRLDQLGELREPKFVSLDQMREEENQNRSTNPWWL